MTKRIIISIIAAIISCTAAMAQYTPAPVTISKQKVKVEGKSYYIHTVLEKQTLYSIAREYGASIEEIYEANDKFTSYDLRNKTLREGSKIFIPVTKKKKGADTPEEEEPVEISEPAEIAESVEVADTVTVIETPAVVDTIAVADTVAVIVDEPEAVEEYDGNVDVMLLLPFKISGRQASRNYMDFYSGVLLAAREEGLEGIDINLSVYDCGKGLPKISEEELSSTDVIIGPVSPEDMVAMLEVIPEDNFIVSPLDPRTDSLAATHPNFIQVRGNLDAQYADLVAWVGSEYKPGDAVVVLFESEKKDGVDYVTGLLDEAEIPYQTYSYNIERSKVAMSGIRSKMTRSQMNHVILVSDAEVFTNDAIKNVGLAGEAGLEVSLYCQSKARSYETTDPEMMYKANMHVTRQYDIDYDDNKIKDFLLKYRAVFKTEPTSFSYQGYDLLMYFAGMVSNFKGDWKNMLDKNVTEKFLHTDFKFTKVSEEGGYINTALRHEVLGEEE